MAYEVLSKGNIEKLAKNAARGRKIRPFDWISLASLVAILVIFVYAGYFTREFMVDVTKVTREYPFQINTRLNAIGRVVVDHVIDVMPRTAGQLVEVLVKEGDQVKKGQVVARLESTDAALSRDQSDADLKLANANLEQAVIVFNEAELDHEHSKDLYQKGSLSESGYHASLALFRKAKSAVNVAQATVRAQTAALHGAEVALGYTQVKAPVDGIVLKTNAHGGDTVSPLGSSGQGNSGIVSLAEFSSLRVEAEVPESEFDSIKMGEPCVIIVDALKQKRLRGEVDAVIPAADENKGTATVRVNFIDYDTSILPDMTADIALLSRPLSPDDTAPITVVDRSALVVSRGGHTVYLVKGERAVEKRVSIGAQFKDKVEIREGLSCDDIIIINPPDALRKGSRVIPNKI